jgi:hypothetical protein
MNVREIEEEIQLIEWHIGSLPPLFFDASPPTRYVEMMQGRLAAWQRILAREKALLEKAKAETS